MNIDQQKKINALEMIIKQNEERIMKQKHLIIGLAIAIVCTVIASVGMLVHYT